jgi:hypothetical protein
MPFIVDADTGRKLLRLFAKSRIGKGAAWSVPFAVIESNLESNLET